METKRLIEKKATARKLALKGVNPDSFDEFKSLRSSVEYNIQKDYNTYLRHTENNLISDPKKFWSYFKNENINTPDSLFYNNVCYENDGDIANAFADYFSSVFKSSTDLMEMMNAKATASVILLKSKALPMMMWFWLAGN
ncbi:hypothetical protein AVEN_167372-1 [Araneus ventricosus]|uniref:Uncharacterized protein n=1 Tax=Araneus ventricosus TaxID=182803 RepID=A0A4Y2LXD9_ARAVE|nr:hypothetical protein AVEN_236953-1 [Araneus ventricosus]GBN18810.1 hypothetical protein AVEN_167372-1 [Araneus ventricosus]